MKKLNILVACEESQAVTKELRNLGHNAYSCDLLKCSGGKPQWHFNMDVFKVIKNKGGVLQNGKSVTIKGDWDMMIAHPPCTFLAVSGAKWYYDPADKDKPVEERKPHPRFPNRVKEREEAVIFFKRLWNVKIPKIAIENPVGIMSTRLCKPTQIVQPWMFGDEATKTTCLWLKGLPLLTETDKVDKGERRFFKSGKSQPMWYSNALTNAKSSEERRTLRSKTFLGMAKAMAEQWTK
jgi:hypothetical protein